MPVCGLVCIIPYHGNPMLVYRIIGNSGWHPVGRMPKARRWVARLNHLRKVEMCAARERSKTQMHTVNVTGQDTFHSAMMALYVMFSSHASQWQEQHDISINWELVSNGLSYW